MEIIKAIPKQGKQMPVWPAGGEPALGQSALSEGFVGGQTYFGFDGEARGKRAVMHFPKEEKRGSGNLPQRGLLFKGS